MPKDNAGIEIRIAKAMASLSEQSKPNIAKTAREFAVPLNRLRHRWNGGKSLFQRQPNGRKLSSAQESALRQFIEYFDNAGASINQTQIAIAANSILEEAHTNPAIPPPKIGEHWVERFLKRNPQYHLRRRRALDIERSRALDKGVVEFWFEDYIRVVNENGILPEDIYNFDETGFQIGVGQDQWIVTREPKRKIFNGSVTNRESVTVMEAVSADGFVCPPLIILSAKQIMLRWFDAIQTDEHLAVSDTGYMNDVLALQWIRLFHKWTIHRTRGAKRLVLCDRFGSHYTRQFGEFCDENNIILFFLLPHTSHVLQPLDVGVFSAYKHWHSEAVEAASITGCQKFTKDEFLYAIATIRDKTFRPHTIKLGFRLTGLWPIDSKLITNELVEYDPYLRQVTPSTSSLCTDFSTPKTTEKVKKLGAYLNSYNDHPSRFQKALDKITKSAEAQTALAYELQREFDCTKAIMEARYARYNTSRVRAPISGIVNKNQLKEIKRKEYKLTEKADIKRRKRKWPKVCAQIRRHGRLQKKWGRVITLDLL
jgi:DNA-binding transcriptional MerR regulator